MGYASLLLTHKGLGTDTQEPLKEICAAAERAANLTRQLLTFSRKQLMRPQVLDLGAAVGNVIRLLHRIIGEDIALQFNCAGALPPIYADVGMVEQVLMNLAVNARDAMPRGGQLAISAASAEISEDYARHNPEARPGKFVCLSVADNGCGMDQQTLGRLFEPFFTTKEVGKGTGLGLATIYGIVKQREDLECAGLPAPLPSDPSDPSDWSGPPHSLIPIGRGPRRRPPSRRAASRRAGPGP
jgi:signal transduction histidine kinase